MLGTDFTIYERLAILLTSLFFLKFVNDFGKSIWVIIDLIVLLALLTWNLAPVLAYHYFNENNELAVLWDKCMKVDSNTYFSFMLPATLAMIAGLYWPGARKINLKFSIWELHSLGYLDKSRQVGWGLIIIGILSSVFSSYLPSTLNFVAYLTTKFVLVGLFYLYFSGKKSKPYFLIFALSLMFISSLREGMFGEMIYMVALCVIVLMVGTKYTFNYKFTIIIFSVFFLFILQSIKSDYRKVAWASGSEDIGYFFKLATDKLNNLNELTSDNVDFPLSVRFNQGWLISVAMSRVPFIVPYANGESIGISLLASLTPRFLWPDKPRSGGEYNMEHFLGWKNINVSMNISPVGEAWVNFGQIGGTIFMFFYGFIISTVFSIIIKWTYKYPTILFWLPLIFFYVVITETDILTVFNHLLKTCFLVSMIYWLMRKIFNLSI